MLVMSDRLMRQALLLARRGLYVFPLEPGTKEPKRGLRWRRTSTLDPQQIEQWWVQAPYNIGVDTGLSRLLVVDCDVKPPVDGRWNYRHWLEHRGLPMPNTLLVSTPSSGLHVYYNCAVSPLSRNSASKLAPGVDTRGVGGYVVAPGSVLPNGSYKVLSGWNQPLEEVPREILEVLRVVEREPLGQPRTLRRDVHRYAASALRKELESLSGAQEGQRNNCLNRSAFRMGQLCGAGVLDHDIAWQLLVEKGMSLGLPRRETEKTVDSGLKGGEGNPRDLRPDLKIVRDEGGMHL